jgi:hypothetical protein
MEVIEYSRIVLEKVSWNCVSTSLFLDLAVLSGICSTVIMSLDTQCIWTSLLTEIRIVGMYGLVKGCSYSGHPPTAAATTAVIYTYHRAPTRGHVKKTWQYGI